MVSAEIKTNPEGIYDRKKAVEMLADYIGLLHENLITNHAFLYLSNSYNTNSYTWFKEFYGSLIKSLRHAKTEDFRNICNVFFEKYSCPYLKEFFSDFCEISDNRILLKK